MAATLEYEQLNKNLEIVDGHAVKAPEDYQDPEQLYQALVARIRKYHPVRGHLHGGEGVPHRERRA